MIIKPMHWWVLLNIIVFILISFYYPTSFFSSELDGFYSQMLRYSFGDILSGVHGIRKLIIYPFIFLDEQGYSQIFQPLVMLIYIFPIFCMNISKNVKYFSVIILYLTFFLSYRTVLVNIGTYILFFLTFYNISKKIVLYALILSILSSGTLIVSLFFLFINRKKLFKNVTFINKMIVFLSCCLIMYGPVIHKLLFFSDSSKFGGASEATLDEALNVNLHVVLTTLFERGVLYISFINGDTVRFYLLMMNLFFLISLSVASKYKINFILLSFIYCFMMLFEGLGAHSFTLISITYFSSFWFFSFLHATTNIKKQSYS